MSILSNCIFLYQNILYSLFFKQSTFNFDRSFLFIGKLLVLLDIKKFSYSNFLLRYALQQLSEQNDMIPMTELEYFTPSTRLLNSFLHEIQFEYIWNIYTCYIINSLFPEKAFSENLLLGVLHLF
jgi:hypothetical protein